MDWETERKLNDKADKWELHNVQNENRQLKNEISDLEKKIGELRSTNSRHYYVIERIITILSEQPQLSDIANQIIELRCNL
jgi:uncharacterized protein YlxW (UPF0749 family)